MNTNTKNFAGYTCFIAKERSYYGSQEDDVNQITEKLKTMIQSEFPGVDVNLWQDGDDSSSTKGPDQEVCDEINQWISDNWTAAL